MKKTIGAASTALALLVAAGCGSEESGSGEQSRSGGAGQQQEQEQLSIGDTAELEGPEPSATYKVSIANVQDPSEQVEDPRGTASTRYVGVRLQVTNTGDAEVSGSSLEDGVELRTEDGRIYRPQSDLGQPADRNDDQGNGNQSDGDQAAQPSADLGPGDESDQWMIFQVDKDKDPNEVRLNSTSSFTDTETTWKLD